MLIAFPTTKDIGKQSPVYGHFGSAPLFMLLDTEKDEIRPLQNNDAHHVHGQCQPMKALQGTRVDAVVVGGIGRGALIRLAEAGISVYRGVEGSVAENAELLASGRLPLFTPDQTCAGHQGGHGCAH
ncbi:MAG: NifB/NifX family molybdenum-iron cluster-binding protein [Thermodesulfobacteriota bacterium]